MFPSLKFGLQAIRLYIIVVILSNSLIVIALIVYPPSHNFLIGEDHFIENATAIILLITFILATRYLIAVPQLWYRRVFFGIALLALLSFLDEVSYGLRVFRHYEPPIVMEIPIDGIHDFIHLFMVFLGELHKSSSSERLLVSGFCLATLLSVISFVTRRYLLQIDLFRQWLSYNRDVSIYVISAFIFIFIATICDTLLLEYPGSRYVEELSEASYAISLLFCTIYLYRNALRLPVN